MKIFRPRNYDGNVIGYGVLNKQDQIVHNTWSLGLTPTEGGFRVFLHHGIARSGKVEKADEMEAFLNAFLEKLRQVDPGAEISFGAPG